MKDSRALLHCLNLHLSKTTMRQLKHIIHAMLCIPGRITMLSIARWNERGGSYRTVQRWYNTPLERAAMLWAIVKDYLLKPDREYILAGDEVVISKAEDLRTGAFLFEPGAASDR